MPGHFTFTAAALALCASVALTPRAHAQEVLNFAGLNGVSYESVENYYNGGYGSLGSGPGTNYGITFSANGIVCSGYPACNSDQIPGGTGAEALFFESGSSATMDIAAGFTGAFSFDYTAPSETGVVSIWSGLDATGTLLATINLPTTPNQGPGCQAAYCPYLADGTTFAGTAESVSFAGTENYIAFADLTLGSTVPGEVPEPMSIALLGTGLAGLGVGRRFRLI